MTLKLAFETCANETQQVSWMILMDAVSKTGWIRNSHTKQWRDISCLLSEVRSEITELFTISRQGGNSSYWRWMTH